MDAQFRQNVQVLLDQPHGEGMVVSCYADMSVSEGFETHWRSTLKTEAARVRQQLESDPEACQGFERNMESIRQALESTEVQKARGMAVFSGLDRKLFVVVLSQVPWPTRIVVDEEPYLVPLLEAEFRQRGYLVLQVDTHRARWWAIGPAGGRLLGEIDEEVPPKQHSAGECWGKQQATIARHREDVILHVHKDLAGLIDAAWGEYPYQGIILLGARDVLAMFQQVLPVRLAAHIVHESALAWTAEMAEVEAIVHTVHDQERRDRERYVLGELDRRLHEAAAVAAGPQEVLEAMRNGQVRNLILGPDPGLTAWRCPGCHWVFAAPHDACGFCGTPCQQCSLWQEMLGFAIRHGIWVDIVTPSPALAEHGDAAALLNRDEPPWSRTARPAAAETTEPVA